MLAGIAIAVGGALMPALVRDRFPDRVGPITGLYTTALISGALIGSGGTEPLRAALGDSWQAALAIWAVPAALALAVWLVVRPLAAPPPPGRRGRPAGRRGGTGTPGWSPSTWEGSRCSTTRRWPGWPPATRSWAGRPRGPVGCWPCSARPRWCRRWSRRRWPAATRGRPSSVGLLIAIGCLALIGVSPLSAPALWAALLGVGVGANFALALTVVGQMAPTPADTPRASGMAFFVGYLLASLGPVAVGFLHDLTGGFRWPFLSLLVVGAVTLAAALPAARPR